MLEEQSAPSAFSRDEARHREQDAREHNRPHRHHQRAHALLKQSAKTAAADEARRHSDKEKRETSSNGLRHVTINPPHKALLANNSLVIEVRIPATVSGSDAAKPPNFPFRILSAGDATHMKVKSYVDSLLFVTTDITGAGYTITNLTTALTTGIGYVDYLEITLDNTLTVTAAERKNANGGWSGYGAMTHQDSSDPDNPFIDKIYIQLAKMVNNATEAAGLNRDGTIISDGTNTARIIQTRRNHIYLEAQRDAAGLPTLFPMPPA